jgi:hypothetical protein
MGSLFTYSTVPPLYVARVTYYIIQTLLPFLIFLATRLVPLPYSSVQEVFVLFNPIRLSTFSTFSRGGSLIQPD